MIASISFLLEVINTNDPMILKHKPTSVSIPIMFNSPDSHLAENWYLVNN